MIEEAHELAITVLTEHMAELHKISAILIERETIDKDQFERLLAGAPEEEIFAEEEQPEAEAPADEPKRLPKPKPRPFPLPGATMQPPPPEGAKELASPNEVRLALSAQAMTTSFGVGPLTCVSGDGRSPPPLPDR